jgi:hypothetical protein
VACAALTIPRSSLGWGVGGRRCSVPAHPGWNLHVDMVPADIGASSFFLVGPKGALESPFLAIITPACSPSMPFHVINTYSLSSVITLDSLGRNTTQGAKAQNNNTKKRGCGFHGDNICKDVTKGRVSCICRSFHRGMRRSIFIKDADT